jgi:hypothetical protein
MRLYELIEDLDSKLQQFAQRTQSELGLETFDLHMSGDDIKLNLLGVKKDNRKEGVGSEAMKRLTQFADRHDKRIILSPGLKDDNHGTTSRSRLVKFYKRFGFRENKGRNIDFTISAGMVRDPKSNINEANKNTGFQLFVDMDEVLCDFESGVEAFMADPSYGEKYTVANYKIGHGQQSSAFWNKMAHANKMFPEAGKTVWAELDWMPDGKQLWNFVKPYNPTILSSPGTSSAEMIVAGKNKWLDRNGITGVARIFESKKWNYAKGKPGVQNILIDDRSKQIDPWVANGGIGILHTNTASTIKELKKWGF